ncbi:hypothetical protein [Sphingomonas corticis]|jgi:hypothetical protein|uniref:DUF2163 domain-containing protein n=1 Tax=Sphingomonas corticis TaxID=2722791 RepID=A0ABX1CT00_9SPHN|nr:hypothetical protein [Sphingomonas corticis]NJR80461.1 hypothetical protein [Sphingomonas corticis]
MSQLTPQLDAKLRTDAPVVFGAVTVSLPDYEVNLLDGSGVLAFGGRTYVGDDATFGTISEVEDLTDGAGDSAPAFSMTLLPASDAAAATLARPQMQGSPVMVWIGAVDELTGMAVPDPHLIFVGELDVPTLRSSEHGRALDYEVTSVFERLFEDDESARLSPGHHRSIFPNEAGLDYVTGVSQPVYWGIAGNPSAISYQNGAGLLGGVGGVFLDRIAEMQSR